MKNKNLSLTKHTHSFTHKPSHTHNSFTHKTHTPVGKGGGID